VRKSVDGLDALCNTISMTTNEPIEVCEETINYFVETFEHQGMIYLRQELMRQISKAQTDYYFYEEQSKQFASRAQSEKDRIEGLKYELAAVNSGVAKKREIIMGENNENI
jgi:hypothetical protein